MFPHVITLYNALAPAGAETREEAAGSHVTVLRGVLLDERQGDTVDALGHNGADACTLYAPFSVQAIDGFTGVSRKYAAPDVFQGARDKSGLWTFGLEGSCFFLKGEFVAPGKPLEELEQLYGGAYTIIGVHARDYGTRDMRHWEVTAC